ncbi:MAG: HAMP domain-containing histidine kinase, partial [Clostridioides sp.]|nr:HAMP domain-containing histidine kinase [Clostridioides sp.]
ILLFIVIYFLSEREIVYQEITKYLEGKVDKNKIKSSHIDKKKTKSNNIEHFALNNGNLYVLFNEIEKLTDSLKEKSEKEYNAKEFIKMSVSDISHQIKTPLAAIKMYNEIILEEPKNHDLIMDFSVNISKSICRIEELIKTLLKLSRIDSESITFKKDKYSISDLIEKSIQELSVRAINEGKKIEVIGSKKDEIFCDFNWTVEAIENIIKNALDNTREGCFVRIMWEKFDTIFSITIEDNGKGIDEKDIHHIFKRFYRSEDSGNLQGVGLGLSLTKSIVEKQGGTVSVKSEKGIGTQFSLVFLNEM